MKMTSCQAPLMDESCRAIAAYLAQRLGLAVDFIDQIDWHERYRQLDAGGVDLAWICGAPYVRRREQSPANLELLVAPVWQGERYAGRPIYFSDLIVRADGPLQRFMDLQGATWVYNDPGSFSGYAAMRYHLAVQGLDGAFFGRVVASGGHQRSVEWVLAGDAEVSAIDSTVLAALLLRRPSLAEQLRVVDTIGPSPMPPWVVSRQVPAALRQAIRRVMVSLADDAEGQAILAGTGIARFVAVADGDYDRIRAILHTAGRVTVRSSER